VTRASPRAGHGNVNRPVSASYIKSFLIDDADGKHEG
jgi:hypothetical protein